MLLPSVAPRPGIQYSDSAIARAERAVRCSPFCFNLFAAMKTASVALQEIAGPAGVNLQFCKYSLPELLAENELMWLIQVGLLRREVDGQGLTDRFRLTPLGHQLLDRWQNGEPPGWSAANLADRFYNVVARWGRLPW